MIGLGTSVSLLESTNSSGVSTSELIKLEIVLKTVCFESSESMREELEEKLGQGETLRSENTMRESWG